MDRDRRYDEGCHSAGREAGSIRRVAAVAIENTEGGKWIKENYKFSHCIPEELQSQVDRKVLESFKASTAERFDIMFAIDE
ncbi:hypothetical protein F2P81_016805 [Scophthalmus maximus]|uniref:Uncharacterized protein n=1 Tax=Scophthalmus maximus TaxID=52904 RepID=A0A6A4SGL0_SCOMX|nr:hypothetical protein F2P81_016805 [Scophthalmus maximus]